ncbi:hypothetical protein OG568_60800 (plasmid) [Streptomyces sp. NBC_01450]|uniref:hypothetical protein n=1 Tax=Streptomyces sp. NBC_01450 TaxID=2903871 RepID=UPI002E351D57|nr:hypothetical protein [Streptomyces sp. NBC_01450]
MAVNAEKAESAAGAEVTTAAARGGAHRGPMRKISVRRTEPIKVTSAPFSHQPAIVPV